MNGDTEKIRSRGATSAVQQFHGCLIIIIIIYYLYDDAPCLNMSHYFVFSHDLTWFSIAVMELWKAWRWNVQLAC